MRFHTGIETRISAADMSAAFSLTTIVARALLLRLSVCGLGLFPFSESLCSVSLETSLSTPQ